MKLNIVCGRDSAAANIFSDRSHFVTGRHQRGQSELISLNLQQAAKTAVRDENPFGVSSDAYNDLSGDGSLGFDTQPGSGRVGRRSEVILRKRSQSGKKPPRNRLQSPKNDFDQLQHLVEFLKDQLRTKDKLLVDKDLKIEQMQTEKSEMQHKINYLQKQVKSKEKEQEVHQASIKQYEEQIEKLVGANIECNQLKERVQDLET